MSSNKHFDDLNITRDEFQKIKKALEKEEFRKLFLDYCEEIQDPENRKLYEKEIKQLEAERGVDVTFLNPEPGFVVKTSINGTSKCFLNIAKCNEVAAPKSVPCSNPKDGSKGYSWSIPHAIPPPRDDFDNKRVICKVFDILFHPDALDLAEKNKAFKRCLIDTACDGVEREYKFRLDRTNLKFPKLKFKGIQRASVIRKLSENAPSQGEEEEFDPLEKIYPAKPTSTHGTPKNYECVWETERREYCEPKYVIKHRRPIDMSEMTYELDAKINITLPNELVVEIDLPLLKSTANCTLDVTEKNIYIVSEKPAKYKLNIELPYEVNDKDGTAKFDLNKRQLIITLPVKRAGKERFVKDIYKEDSGVESDLREEMHSSGSDSPVVEIEENNHITTINEDDQKQNTASSICCRSQSFLKNSIQYVFPHFDCNVLDEVIAIIIHVRNVENESVELIKDKKYFHGKFTSFGTGYYPIHYAFYFEFPEDNEVEIKSVEPEVWDNNLVLTLNLEKFQNFEIYFAGVDKSGAQQFKIQEKFITNAKTKQLKLHENSSQLDISVERPENENSVEIEIKSKTFNDVSFQKGDHDYDTSEKCSQETNKKMKKRNKKRRSLSESVCDDIRNFQRKEIDTLHAKNKFETSGKPESGCDKLSKEAFDSSPKPVLSDGGCPIQTRFPRKQRSFSESRENMTPTFKGILKHYSRYSHTISDSCSSIDDPSSYSCSVDGGLRFAQSFSDIPEENSSPPQCLSESCKKTVRFNEVIKKQVFRLDSSILGQRKKNQKKKNKKQRALQRRHSEGDSADYEDNKSPCNENQFLEQRINQNKHSQLNTIADDLVHEGNITENSRRCRNESELSDAESKNALMFDIDM